MPPIVAKGVTLGVCCLTIAAGLSVFAPPILAQAGASYLCDEIEVNKTPRGEGAGNCKASGGAPKNGKITQNFEILDRTDPDTWLECKSDKKNPAGEASLPSKVTGSKCEMMSQGE
ncbi:hypothetical protein ACIA8C_04790 [Nocardia sp. NPDC051321]|uniref:hypothetical protein n=1 Tax=Nocardia sp. NPDC051321 TaxID=3364323 RepID=UPI0037917E79